MNKYISSGLIAGVLGALVLACDLSGHPALGSFFADPATNKQVTEVIGILFLLGAGVMKGIKKDEHK